jgi:uncharacterized protein YllA (UPF0747 family)
MTTSSAAPLTPLASLPLRDAASRYLREHEGGSPLYPAGSLASAAASEKRARKLDAWRGDRAALAAWLAEQNSHDAIGPLHPAQAKNLAAAAQPGAVFVLTGQQPGLLGGPALALHKALTAVAHARAAAARFEKDGQGRPVIPIFWAAGDDSDLAESNAAEFLEPGAASHGASGLSLGFDDPEDAIPMSLRVPSEEERARLFEGLPASWSEEIRNLVRDAYAPNRSLTQGFLRVMQALLGEEGVLFVDGFSASQRAQGVLGRVANASAEFHEALARGTKRLSDALGQPPQVPVRPGTVPVFLFENGRRERLFASDSGRVYTAGAEGRDLRSDLSSRVLLHSALTRPLVVEELFPTLGHVLGPAELRYFAQIADVFPAFDLSFPLLAPREQMMIVPAAGWRALQDLGFRAGELFDLRPSLVRERLTERAWQGHPAAQDFPESAQADFQAILKAYQARWFSGVDFDSSHRRLGRAFGHYRDQARKRVFEQHAAEAFQALQPLLRWLGNGAQDRHLGSLSLRSALGARGFAVLKEMLMSPQGAAHAAEWTDEQGVFG